MKNIALLLAAAASLAVAGCNDRPDVVVSPPAQPVPDDGPNPADECPREDGRPCF